MRGMAKVTKSELASVLASIEYSVYAGMQTEDRWVRSYMRHYTREMLIEQVRRCADKATDPARTGFNYLTTAQVERLVDLATSL